MTTVTHNHIHSRYTVTVKTYDDHYITTFIQSVGTTNQKYGSYNDGYDYKVLCMRWIRGHGDNVKAVKISNGNAMVHNKNIVSNFGTNRDRQVYTRTKQTMRAPTTKELQLAHVDISTTLDA